MTTTPDTAIVRDGTPFESGLLSGEPPRGATAYDAWSYRVPARFAGRVRVVLTDRSLTVCGPRVPRGVYAVWWWLFVPPLFLAPAAFIWALSSANWGIALAATAMVVWHLGVSSLGAGLWPGLGEVRLIAEGAFEAVEIAFGSIRDVTLGRGWARNGVEHALILFVKGIDQVALGHAVNFTAPDGEGRRASYSLHLLTTDEATALYEALRDTSTV